MKILSLVAAVVFLVCSSGKAQTRIPEGASNFFNERGGLNLMGNNIDPIRRISGNKVDNIEGGGGAADWARVSGRIFIRSAWMIEIGEMADGYGAFELEHSLAAEMQTKLVAEGFRLTPAKFDLHHIRYQKGSTIGTVEVRSFFLNSGNLPLRYEFIFNESYLEKPRNHRIPKVSPKDRN